MIFGNVARFIKWVVDLNYDGEIYISK